MLTRYYDSILKTHDLFDAFKTFDDLYGTRALATKSWGSNYRTEVTDDGLTLSIDLPGVKSKDLNVQITGRDVKVSGTCRGTEFNYSYRVSKDLDPDTLDASLEDGVLFLKLKNAKGVEPRTVTVRVK